MSGFEIAGIVLAAFPLAINALDKYREVATRLGLLYKIRLEYNKCRNELNFQRLAFKRNLEQLLLPLVMDERKTQLLLANPGGDAWKEKPVAHLLEARLQDSYELYLEYVKGMEQVLAKLHEALAVSSQPVQGNINSPVPSQTRSTRFIVPKSRDDLFFQLYRLKFSNGEAVRKKHFAELQDYNTRLEKLLGFSNEQTQIAQQKAVTLQETAIDNTICTFWVQATKLFRALATVCNCPCRDRHCAKLLLQHRTTKKPVFNVIFTTSLTSGVEIFKTKISEGDDGTAAAVKETVAILETAPTRLPVPGHRQYGPKKSALRTKDKTARVGFLQPSPSTTLTPTIASPSDATHSTEPLRVAV